MNPRVFIGGFFGILSAGIAALIYLQTDEARLAPVAIDPKAAGSKTFQAASAEAAETDKLEIRIPNGATAAEQKKLRQLSDELVSIREETKSLRKALDATSSPSAVAADISASTAPAPAPKAEFERVINQAAWIEALKTQTATYADFISENALSPEIAEQLIRIKTEFSTALQETLRARYDAATPSRAHTKEITIATDHQRRLSQLLGEESARRLQVYDHSIPNRLLLSNVRGDLAKLGIPIDDTQAQAALAIIRDEHRAAGISYDPSATAKIRENIAKRISGLLTLEQLPVLDAERKKWEK